MSLPKRLTRIDLDGLTIGDLEEFCATARRDGAGDDAPVLMVEVSPFLKRYRLQVLCPPNAPKEMPF